MSLLTPFHIRVPQAELNRIQDQIRKYPWNEMQMPPKSAWQLGTPVSFMQELADYWVKDYDWRKQEQHLNRFNHFTVAIDEQVVHIIHEKGSGTNPQPLLLLHGWPYSFHSFIDVIEPLAHPERFGGDPNGAFDVVVASLPGYGFSGKPAKPIGPQAMATLLNRLMTDALGYNQYLVQGGDWGGYIASRLGYDHAKHILGIHSNSFMVRHAGAALGSGQVGADNATSEEQTFVQQEAQGFMIEGGYSIIQATRPISLNYGMMDSAVGAAAWIIEKFHAWSDQRERAFDVIFPKDRLISEVMIYLTTHSFNTATWIYAAYLPEQSSTLPPGKKVDVPVAFAAFPDPVFAPPPRSFMERSHNVVQWNKMPQGGHFPVLEAPELWINDVRTFGQLVKRK